MLSLSLKTSALQCLGTICVAYPFSPKLFGPTRCGPVLPKTAPNRSSLIKEDIRLYCGVPLGHPGAAFQP